MFKLKPLLTEGTYKYGCVMGYLPSNTAHAIVNFNKTLIPDEVLYFDPTGKETFGRELEPHITIKFGLTKTYTKEEMQQLLSGIDPFYIKIQKIDLFQNPLFDVVKFNVEGDPELYKFRDVLDKLPNADEHKEYHPHMTLAYVQPGQGPRYVRKSNMFAKVLISTIVYSHPAGKYLYTL